MCQCSSMEGGEVVVMTVGVAGRSTMLLVGDDIVNRSTLSTSSSSMCQQMVINKNCTSRMAAHVCYLLYCKVVWQFTGEYFLHTCPKTYCQPP